MGPLIIFDFDGVIIDSRAFSLELWQWEWPGFAEDDLVAMYKGNVHTYIKDMPVHRTKEEKEEQQKTYFRPKKATLSTYEWIQEIIVSLWQDHTLVINTSSGEAWVKTYLAKQNIDTYFADVFGKETNKDKREKFRLIMDKYQVKPEECIFITDTLGDFIEASECNIPTLIVTYGFHKEEIFDDIKDKVVGFANTPQEILNFIKI